MRYRFDTLYLTAHSMGGLVVRTFLLNHGAQFPQAKLFVSLSTPWGGEASAETGVRHSPAVVPSWHDMQPSGRFMQALFARRLPAGVDYYLLFGHKGGYSMLRPNNDGTVTLASQLRDPAQAEARRVYGFDEDHDSILSSPRVLAQYRARDDSAHARRQRPALGPVPPGEYDASLMAPSFRTEPRRLRVRVEPGRAPVASLRLVPQGALSGYVGADATPTENPAGSYRPPHESVRIRRITLSGSGVTHTLVPVSDDADASVERYLAGEDYAWRSYFSFVALPEGDYVLTIEADGYRPHVSRHRVVAGRPAQFAPVVMSAER